MRRNQLYVKPISPKKIKFDILKNGRFVKTLTLEYKEDVPSIIDARALAMNTMPTVLKDGVFEVFFHDNAFKPL